MKKQQTPNARIFFYHGKLMIITGSAMDWKRKLREIYGLLEEMLRCFSNFNYT